MDAYRLPGSAAAAAHHQLPMIESGAGRSLLSLTDDNVMIRQVVETHNPDSRMVDVKPLFNLTEEIIRRIILPPDTSLMPIAKQAEVLEDKLPQLSYPAMLEYQAYAIDKISSEIAFNALNGVDAHSTTLSIFSNTLTNYSWEAKAVLALAAFSRDYGEYWLFAQIFSSIPISRPLAMLKQVPLLLEPTEAVKSRLKSINDVIKGMLEVTKCVLQFHELPATFINAMDVPAFEKGVKHIPAAAYWIVRSIVSCMTHILVLTTAGHDFAIMSSSEAMELSTLNYKLQQTLKLLKDEYEICKDILEQKWIEARIKEIEQILNTGHLDNIKTLKALIYEKDDILPLFDGNTKKRVSLDVLRKKNVLLLITDLHHVSRDELVILEQIYNEYRQHASRMELPYELVWIPIASTDVWTDELETNFQTLRAPMPWYSVAHPQIIGKAPKKFIQQIWKFNGENSILVLIDPFGKKVSDNAIHMMWIWGSNAFPFTATRERQLWESESWRFELVVDSVDQLVLDWIKEDMYIMLYGGDDFEWIRRLTTTAKSLAQTLRIQLEMAYVGKSSYNVRVQQIVNRIASEKLGISWDRTVMWFFWKRIESMLQSKIQLRQVDNTNPITREIKRLLCYDKHSGWALLAKGSRVLFIGDDYTVFTTLVEYERWKDEIPVKGLDRTITEYALRIQGTQTNCSRMDFRTGTVVPEGFNCPECDRGMSKHIAFRCCHENKGHHQAPTRHVPAGQVPTGHVPTGSVPGGLVPAGQVPSAPLPGGLIPKGQVPAQSVTSGTTY